MRQADPAAMNALILVALTLLAGGILAPLLIHRAYRAPKVAEHGTPADSGMPYWAMRIPTANGKRLFAWFIPLPEGLKNGPAVVVMHGWGGNAGHMLPFASLLHREGYAVLLLDARNHGNSDSDSFSSMPRFAEDLEHGLDWLGRQPRIDPRRLFLLGHSVGAAASLLAASRRQDLAGVVSISAFAHPADLMRRQMRSHHIPHLPIGWLLLRYIERAIKASFDDIAPCNTIRRVVCPVLLVHGEEDECIPRADVRQIYANRLDDRVELLLLPEIGHDSREAISAHGGSLLAFLRRSTAGIEDRLRSLRDHHAALRRCCDCPDMTGPPVAGQAVSSPVMLIGQAPGTREIETGQPFAWTAGKTLFGWFAGLGLAEQAFRSRVTMSAVCRCFPGKNPGGGDRVPNRGEVEQCARWWQGELALVRPRLLIPVGRLAISRFLDARRLVDVVGSQWVWEAENGWLVDVIPLPHPSGISTWFKTEPGRTLLEQALGLIDAHPAWQEVVR